MNLWDLNGQGQLYPVQAGHWILHRNAIVGALNSPGPRPGRAGLGRLGRSQPGHARRGWAGPGLGWDTSI